MNPSLHFILGMEVLRFAPSDSSASALESSLNVLQAGVAELPVYQGPAIQPYVGLRGGNLRFALAPAVSIRSSEVASVDRRSESLRVVQWRVDGRLWWQSESWLAGADLGYAAGHAKLGSEEIAEALGQWNLAPTFGWSHSLESGLSLIGRARWPVRWSPDGVEHGLGGAIAVEFSPVKRGG